MIRMRDICVSFRSERQEKIFGVSRTQVLFDVSLSIPKGSCLGILGESGSGKSTLGRVICGLLKPDSGEYLLEGKNVYATSANPRFRIRNILAEGIRVKERKSGKKMDRSAEYCRLLELVGLDETFLDRFPHELSGGQLQRVCIARAVACEPEFILFDEAISSLDAHTQVQVMDLLKELKEKLGLTYVFITHDLTSVTYLCDEVMFLYKGRITEHIPVSRIAQTTDVYARKLLDSIIEFDEEYDDEMDVKESEESA